MAMPGRSFATPDYRFGFGGHEKDDEFKGQGNHISFNDLGYDPRTGIRWSLDPLFNNFPWLSPYGAFNANPILYEDPSGNSGEASINKETRTITITSIYKFYGGGSSPKIAKKYATSIQKAFNDAHGTIKIDGVEYNVQFIVIGVDISKSSENAIKNAISNNTDIKVNYFRLEITTDEYFNGTSYTDRTEESNGGSTGFWSTEQVDLSNQTTPSHEHNHGLGGLKHPEELNPSGGNSDQTPSIDMNRMSSSFVKEKYKVKGDNSKNYLDVTKRQVKQKNIVSLFSKDMIKKLKENGKVNVGKITYGYHEN